MDDLVDSNCPEVSRTIPVEDRLEANKITLNAKPSHILSLQWIIDKDCLQVCQAPSKQCPQNTTH